MQTTSDVPLDIPPFRVCSINYRTLKLSEETHEVRTEEIPHLDEDILPDKVEVFVMIGGIYQWRPVEKPTRRGVIQGIREAARSIYREAREAGDADTLPRARDLIAFNVRLNEEASILDCRVESV